MKISINTIGIDLSLALLLGGVASAQSASLEGLGFLPDQVSPWSEAHGVTEDGESIVGSARRSGESYALEPFVWTRSSGMIGLGAPALSNGTPQASASGISADGATLVGDTRFELEGSAACTWRRGEGYRALEPLRGSYAAEALAVSGDGAVIVGQSRFGGGYIAFPTHAEGIVWSGQSRFAVGLFPGGFQTTALGVSGDGRVVVGEALRAEEEGQTAFRWTREEGLVSLGDLPGGYHYSRANAASQDGSIIVGFGTTSFSGASFSTDQHACVWINGSISQLPSPPNTDTSEATALTPDGHTIVGWVRVPGDDHPAIWSPAQGGRDLFVLLSELGVDTSDWYMGHATAVSADGHVVVGSGRRHSTGTQEAFRAYVP